MRIFIVSTWNDSFQGSNTQVENWAGTEHDEACARLAEILHDNGAEESTIDKLCAKVNRQSPSGKRANWTDGDGGHVQIQAFDIHTVYAG